MVRRVLFYGKIALAGVTMNAFEMKVDKFITEQRMLQPGDRVVIGVSGGADSTALLFVMLALKDKYNTDITVVHINHGLRPEAVDEALIVKGLCEQYGLTFILREYDVETLAKENKKSCEEMGRELRYQAFEDVAGADGKIMVAHNMNDLGETMLFNLFRGTGITGLASIAPVRGNIVRPLLCVTRQEIEDYLKDIGVPYCTDKSNFTDDYTRNRIRNNILPIITSEISGKAIEHMANTAGQLRELGDYVTSQGKLSFARCLSRMDDSEVVFEREEFDREDIYIRKLMIKLAIDRLVPGNRDITTAHLESVLKRPANGGHREVNLPYGLIGFTSYNLIGIKKPKSVRAIDDEYIVNAGNDIVIDGVGKFQTSYVDVSKFTRTQEIYTKYINCDKIIHQLSIRTRREGDYIVVNSDGGRKKLKDYFIDVKVPYDKRDEVLLLADGDRILWVVGYRISEDSKVSAETGKILKITFIKDV